MSKLYGLDVYSGEGSDIFNKVEADFGIVKVSGNPPPYKWNYTNPHAATQLRQECDLSNRVKKTGDTMTGSLKFSGGNNREVGLLFSGDGTHEKSNIDIGWNYANYDGASVALLSSDFGADGISEAMRGGFSLTARSNVATKQLVGLTDGTLQWDGKKVLTTTPNVSETESQNESLVTTTSTSGVTIKTLSHNTKTGRYIVFANAVYKTDKYSANMKITCADTQIASDVTNLTTSHQGVLMGVRTTTANATETINLIMAAQSGATATLLTYNRYRIIAFDIPYL